MRVLIIGGGFAGLNAAKTSGFKNRFLVVMHWAWYFFTFRKGARLIVNKEWRLYDHRKL